MSSSVPMSGGSAATMQHHVHRDVLEADIPDTASAREALTDELKRRAKNCLAAKAYREAELLYEKAIAVVSDKTDSNDNNKQQQQLAILYSNLALTQAQMGFWEASWKSAKEAVKWDPSYVKGHWRLGQALRELHRPQEALEAIQAAVQLDPTNKALQKEIVKLEALLQEERDLMQVDDEEEEEEKVHDKPSSTTTTNGSEQKGAVETKSTTTSTTTKKSKDDATAAPGSTTNQVMMDDDDDDAKEEGVFTSSDHVRGYKVVNGKKTTFFHTELSEDAKRLIGDIAPKRLDTTTTTTTNSSVPSNTATTSGTSAWNQAGTWEERDVTEWAKDTLRERLLATSYTLPPSSPAPPGTRVYVSKVPKCQGHASFATVRGKKRYIYEFCVVVEWKMELPCSEEEDDDSGTTAHGEMTFPDVDGTCELGEGYDMVHWEVDRDTKSELKPLLDRFVKNGGLRDEIHETMDEWVRLFRATY